MGIFLNKSAGKRHWKPPEIHRKTSFKPSGSRLLGSLGRGSELTGCGSRLRVFAGNCSPCSLCRVSSSRIHRILPSHSLSISRSPSIARSLPLFPSQSLVSSHYLSNSRSLFHSLSMFSGGWNKEGRRVEEKRRKKEERSGRGLLSTEQKK